MLGEALVLFRSTKGVVGLLEPAVRAPQAYLSYGVPEPEGIVASTTARSTGSPAASAQP